VPKTAAPDFLAILRTLREHGVAFIVVGGVGAVHWKKNPAIRRAVLYYSSSASISACLYHLFERKKPTSNRESKCGLTDGIN
jgi:hypothetical protein